MYISIEMGESYMKKSLMAIIVVLLIMLASCKNEPTTDTSTEERQQVELTKISTDQNIDQEPSNQAKEKLRNYEEITEVKAVNTKKDMLIAFDIEHHERFSLDQFEKELKKDMKKEFPDIKVHVSTDQKIILEVERLEEKLLKNDLSDKKLKKELKDIIKLSQEQT